MKLIIAVTGASGSIYAFRALTYLKTRPDVETHLIVSDWAAVTLEQELGKTPQELRALADVTYPNGNLGAAVASGSFRHDGMIVVPCSMKTLASIACGLSSGLIGRAADVTLKENRRLILAVRETPLSPIHLENMLKLARMGVVIMPPAPNFYAKPQTLMDVVDSFVGRMLSSAGVENDLYLPWKGEAPCSER